MEQDEAITTTRISGQERFRRTQRLRSPRDFQRVRRLGRHVSSPLLTLSYARQALPPARTRPSREPERQPAETPEQAAATLVDTPTRVGFSVSKRVGNAVTRNRVRRRLREAVRHVLTDLPPGWDMILVARSGAAATDYATLNAAVRELLARARLTQ